jgi:3-oxoacyl-[acyl-carrier protein] reductase
MDLGLRGKIALVTAASRGLGRAVAHRLAAEGARVTICARGAGDLAAARREIEEASGQPVITVRADVSDPVAVERMAEQVLTTEGRIDILVTNAGGPPPGTFLETDSAAWEDGVRLTLMSAVQLCRSVVPAMQAQGDGAILAVASASVKQPLPNLVLSNSLRMAVVGAMKTLANELAPTGIRVNTICPGWTLTARVEQLLADRAARRGTTIDQEAAAVAADIPLGRMGRPAEFANVAAFLVSPAAAYITGACVLVDGGLSQGSM